MTRDFELVRQILMLVEKGGNCGDASFGVLSAMLHDAALRKARARM